MPAKLKDQISFLIEGSNVIRYHTRPGLRPNTVGHHSHNVVMLMYLLSEGEVSAKALIGGACHDMAEQVVCDVSSPAKRLMRIREMLQKQEDIVLDWHGLKFDLDAESRELLGMADLFDLMLYCCDEIALGNKYAILMMERSRFYVQNELNLNERQQEMYDAIQEIWKENTSDGGPQFDAFYRGGTSGRKSLHS